MDSIHRNQFRAAVIARYPNIPEDALERIVDREARRPANAHLTAASYIPLAIASTLGFIRHNLTPYDTLLGRHVMRHVARDRVRGQVMQYVLLWGGQ